KRTAVHVWISVLLLLLVSHGYSRAAGIGWPEAVARLARERSKAETCVALLKGHGNAAQISNGQLTYGTAKQENDGVIAGLLVALADGGAPESLTSLESRLERGTSNLARLCQTVNDLLPPTSGQQTVLLE